MIFNNGLNDAALSDDPSPVVTVNGPFTASTGTCTTNDVAECDTNTAPALPVKSTVGTPLNPVPEIITFPPPTAAAGKKPVTCGCTTKLLPVSVASVLNVTPPSSEMKELAGDPAYWPKMTTFGSSRAMSMPQAWIVLSTVGQPSP